MDPIVVAVVPVYNPDSEWSSRLSALRGMVSLVIVVDDGSTEVFSAPTDDDSTVVVTQPNGGIAVAINRGIREALERSPDLDFILTVDQDSDLLGDYVQLATRNFDWALEHGLSVGAVCAEKFNESPVRPWRSFAAGRTTLQVAQSGMLFSRSALERFGPFDESLYIDCVDTDFALRMAASECYVLIGDGCTLAHQVGVQIPLAAFGRQLAVGGRARSVSYHSATRRYYITRNRVVVYRRYFSVARSWILRDTLSEARTLLLSLVFGQMRWSQAGAFVRGLVDGVHHRMGKREVVSRISVRRDV